MSAVLSIVYASAPVDEIIIPTIEIPIPGMPTIRVCNGFEDLMLGVDGVFQLFEASQLEISLPGKNTSGQQSLNFGLGNVSGRVQRAVEQALESGAEIPLIYREYLNSERGAPAKTPYVMVITGGTLQGVDSSFEASYYDLLNTSWPRERYTAETAPGIRYL